MDRVLDSAPLATSALPKWHDPPMTQAPAKTRDLEAAIDAVAESYAGQEEINSLESAALPNKRAVLEAYHHLTPVVYLGFYSTRSLNRDNLRYSISEHLYPAYTLLVEQIGRAVTYEERLGRSPTRPAGWSESVVLDLFGQLPELRRRMNEDIIAAFCGDPAAKSVEEIVFSYPAVRAITAHRIANVLHVAGVPMIPRIISEFAHSETGIDIHAGAQIGDRFFIDHGTGVVIGETAVIGNDVKLYQNVTLGALSTSRGSRGEGPLDKKRHPTLEDHVTVYSGATILGGNTVIGARSIIGGNVWLVKSVPPDSKIFGRPKE
jgi:serine O-acetyltransferase